MKKLYLKDLKFILDNYSDGVEAIKDSKTTFDICYRREPVFFSNGEYQKDEKTFGYELRIMIAYRSKCELVEFDTYEQLITYLAENNIIKGDYLRVPYFGENYNTVEELLNEIDFY